MQLIAVRKGGVKCSSACPFYTETGVVRGINGPLKTHCRSTMQDIIVDCDVWNPHNIEKLEVSEEEWATYQKMLGRKAKKERKLYPEDHEEIHAVGCEWTRSRGASEHSDTAPSQPCGDKGKWNAQKSSNVKH